MVSFSRRRYWISTLRRRRQKSWTIIKRRSPPPICFLLAVAVIVYWRLSNFHRMLSSSLNPSNFATEKRTISTDVTIHNNATPTLILLTRLRVVVDQRYMFVILRSIVRLELDFFSRNLGMMVLTLQMVTINGIWYTVDIPIVEQTVRASLERSIPNH